MDDKAATEKKSAITLNALKTMKAAVFYAPEKIRVQQIPVPEPANGEIRVKIKGCGICGSDLPVWEGRPWFNYPMQPGAPGHEAFGTVDALGDNVTNFKPGDNVTILSYHGYAEYDIAKADQAVRLPSFLEDIPFPGEPLGCALNIFGRSEITKEDVVAVIGAGFIGNLLIQLCKSKGATVIAISRRDSSLKMAFESGADHVVKLDENSSVIKKTGEITENKWCSRVIEATGKQFPLDIAGEIVATRGKIIIAGFHQDGLRQINVQNWNWKGIDVINAHERDPQQYIKGINNAIEAIKSGLIKPSLLYSHHFRIEELGDAFEKMRLAKDGFVKGIMRMH